MASHSSILAWRIPWTEEPGRLQSMRPQRVGHRFYSRGKMLVDLGLTQHVKYTRSIMLLSKTFKFLLSSSYYRKKFEALLLLLLLNRFSCVRLCATP